MASASSYGQQANGLAKFEIKQFEAQVDFAKRAALAAAFLQLASRFFGYCSLTWATVVLLGGFASALRLLDFYLISILLLFESVRLFIVQIFSKLLSRAFFREPSRPEEFRFTDRQPAKALRLHRMGQFLSLVLAFAGLVSTIVRFILATHGHSFSEKTPPTGGHSNLRPSLHIFYILVICNSASAVVSSFLHSVLRQRWHGNSIILTLRLSFCQSYPDQAAVQQDSLMHFHDEVYKTAMEVGMPEADQLDILDFAFRKLARDYKRNIRWPMIKKSNSDLIRYLYNGQHGIAMACEYMKGDGGPWKQIVAANLPGLWEGERSIESQVALFWGLRERMSGAGKDAESALNSIECLGQAWADRLVDVHPFLINADGEGTNVVDTLIRLLLEPIRPTLLFQVRAFEACCRHAQVRCHLYKEELGDNGRIGSICAALQDFLDGHHIHSICAALQDFLHGQQAARPQHQSRLRDLCHKLHSIVSGQAGPTSTTTNIYACSALLSLLCDRQLALLGQSIKVSLKPIVDIRINPAPQGPLVANRPQPYFWVEDVVVAETVRFFVGLEPAYDRWQQARVIDKDGTTLTIQAIQDIINQARSQLMC